VIGISILSGTHDTLVPKVLDGLREYDACEETLVLVGGIVPGGDRAYLLDQDVAKIFGPGASTAEIIVHVHDHRPGR